MCPCVQMDWNCHHWSFRFSPPKSSCEITTKHQLEHLHFDFIFLIDESSRLAIELKGGDKCKYFRFLSRFSIVFRRWLPDQLRSAAYRMSKSIAYRTLAFFTYHHTLNYAMDDILFTFLTYVELKSLDVNTEDLAALLFSSMLNESKVEHLDKHYSNEEKKLNLQAWFRLIVH